MIETLTRRPRYPRQRLARKRSPKINIGKAIANTLTMLCAIGCISLILYAIYIAIPHIGYGLWLIVPCLAQAAIIALIGASIQAFVQTRGDRHE